MPDYKPILFNDDMVKAILEGRKTQTRRIVKPKGRLAEEGYLVVDEGKSRPFMPGYLSFCVSDGISTRYLDIKKPANTGDILWVREAFDNVEVGHPWYYRADGDLRPKCWKGEAWMPSIHMPKEAARIFLKVKDVRVEMLQSISTHECVKEGAVKRPNITKRGGLVLHRRYLTEFEKLWDSTVKPADRDVYGWDANPWVWVIEFERCEKPEGWCS